MGTRRMDRDYGLPVSHETARKIIHRREEDIEEEYRISYRNTKKEKRKRMVEIKLKWKAYQQIDIDTKYLTDIPHYYPFLKGLGLPKFQYTARDVATGVLFTAYAENITLSHSTVFGRLLCEFLTTNGVDLSAVKFQYDNGSEFIGSIYAKELSDFEKTLKAYGSKINRIPVGQWSWNSDVETTHGIIEREFFDIETFLSREHFFKKVNNYLFFFNTMRKNSNKKDKTPLDLLLEKESNPRTVLWYAPYLDKLLMKRTEIYLATKNDLALIKKNFNIIPKSVNHVGW